MREVQALDKVGKATEKELTRAWLEEGKQRFEAYSRLAVAMKMAAYARGLTEFAAELAPVLKDWVQNDCKPLFFILVAGHGTETGKLKFTMLGAKQELTPSIFWARSANPGGW